MGCGTNVCILVIPPVTVALVDFTLSFKVNVNFSNLHELLAFFEVTTHLMYVVSMGMNFRVAGWSNKSQSAVASITSQMLVLSWFS